MGRPRTSCCPMDTAASPRNHRIRRSPARRSRWAGAWAWKPLPGVWRPEAQKAFLREAGCYEVQGYVYGRTVPEQEMTARMEAWLAGRIIVYSGRQRCIPRSSRAAEGVSPPADTMSAAVVRAHWSTRTRLYLWIKAIAGKWHTRSRRIFVRHPSATTGASSNDTTVVVTLKDGRKDKQDGLSFDRYRLST